jgi:mRNA interferase MazF
MVAGKRRPALIVRGPSRYGDLLAAAITSRQHHPDGIAITQTDFVLGTLIKPSWVRCDQLHTFDQSLIYGHVGTLSQAAFDRVLARICRFIGCQA